ncbi:MAG: NADH-quinone oxidoreductase subunit L [Pseudonocardiales bacterium]|nr:NADH-quinone oxidoreductase subunit L [Pseudonocardiales bacterium]MBV9031074.1 NADH-quinone oxidoreductase subunit L [Pseudonocardiales bacterium]
MTEVLPAVGTAVGVAHYAWLLVALPALGALVLLVGGRRTNAWGHLLGCATVLTAFGYGVALCSEWLGLDASQRTRELGVGTWFAINSLQVDYGLRLDPLSLTFVLLITGVGGLIHLYAIGYMAHDPGRRRFFGYFNLFVAAMLVLVLSNNFVTLYLGWEGVGLASYLLIGWYQDRPSAATAAKKAFLMNRVGDVGLALAIFLIWRSLGTVRFSEVFARAGQIGGPTLLAITLLLLLGACGKSGQFPLQAWLPDAMEGPTPVSALIHAATMVTAGVYLIARCHPLYDLSVTGRLAVAAVGVVTLLIGSVIGCAYDDIKKVLAYSTVSQIGYMILAVGLGPAGYALGIVHLLTHGFFKAVLFLGAGSVMHGMHDEIDMRRMGGLAGHLPITFVMFTSGYLAIIGFPFLSGYYSKDAIIEAAFGAGGWAGGVLGGIAMLAAGLTAFYMTRLMLMTFFGEERWRTLRSADGEEYHPHESPPVMWVPMVPLAIGSLAAGYFLASGERLVRWLEPSVGPLVAAAAPFPVVLVPLFTVLVSASGVLLAWLVVGRNPVPVVKPERVSLPVAAARADLYANTINETVIARPGTWLTRALVFVDNKGVDGVVNGTAALLGGTSGRVRRLQTGFVRSYALGMLGGSIVVIAVLLAVSYS